MKQPLFRRSALAAVIALSTVLAACKEEPPPVAQSVQPSAAASTASAAVAPQAQPQPINTQASKYTPEALETLLAPVALYPDAVLAPATPRHKWSRIRYSPAMNPQTSRNGP